MKYLLNKYTSFEEDFYSVVTTINDIDFISFPADIGNHNYDAFLVQVSLTDEEVHALPVDEWIEA